MIYPMAPQKSEDLYKQYSNREALREKGQFWTPDWIADAMVEYVLAHSPSCVFDPAVGEGAFFRAVKRKRPNIKLSGTELYEDVLEEALRSGLTSQDLRHVQVRDFILSPPNRKFKAIVANPPYIRHHRLSRELKNVLSDIAIRTIGHKLDGRAGLHIYFLIQALTLLTPGGRLAFIMPADTCEGLFAPPLWHWITTHFRLDAVVTFEPDASPFPDVDVNPLVFFIQKATPSDNFYWARCQKAGSKSLEDWVRSNFKEANYMDLLVQQRTIEEALASGLSRPPMPDELKNAPVLGEFAFVRRGIATGANDFFLLTSEKAMQLNIPNRFLRKVIGRTRDVVGNIITNADLQELDIRGRPTLLLSLDGRPISKFPESVQKYLRYGEELGLPKRALISQRNPWYKMETREVPELLFAYLGRKNLRFILNHANVLPLTSFLCIYPKSKEKEFVKKLFLALSHPKTIENLLFVGKSYGAGAIKIEPRALEKLPIPWTVIEITGLPLIDSKVQQKIMFEFP